MSKLQETTMTTPEQLKEEWIEHGGAAGNRNDDGDTANWWLNKIQSLLGEIEGRTEREIAIHKQLADEWTGIRLDGKIEKINPHLEKIETLDKTLSIIQEYKRKKI